MQWWNDFLTWLSSDDGWRVISTAVIPFVAILVAGIVAALIARGSSRRILAYQDRELKAAAVMALIGAGRKATIWSSLGGDEKQRVDFQLAEADIRIRLLPVNGTNAAADWAAHELLAMKKNSANFSFQADQTFNDFRDRLLEWQNKPKRARKLFAYDLEQWRFEDKPTDDTLVQKQQEWAADQVDRPTTDATKTPASTSKTTPALTPASAPTPAAATPVVTGATATTGATPATTSGDEPVKVFAAAPPLRPATSTAVAPTVPNTSGTLAAAHTGSTATIDTTAESQSSTESKSSTESPDADDRHDDEPNPATGDVYAQPVTASTVRDRTAPEKPLDEQRGTI